MSKGLAVGNLYDCNLEISTPDGGRCAWPNPLTPELLSAISRALGDYPLTKTEKRLLANAADTYRYIMQYGAITRRVDCIRAIRSWVKTTERNLAAMRKLAEEGADDE